MNNEEIKETEITEEVVEDIEELTEEEKPEEEEVAEEIEEKPKKAKKAKKEKKKKEKNEKKEKPKKKGNGKLIALIVIIVLIIVGIIAYFAVEYFVPLGTYNKAGDYAKAGDYEKAIELYQDLGKYQDSEELYFKYVEEYARKLVFDDKDYEKAQKLLEGVYTEDEDITMLLGYANSAVLVKKAEEGDSEAVNLLKDMVMDDYVSGVYSYAEVCVSNGEFTKAKILLDALMERNYRDTQGLYNKLIESDPVARAKTIAGFKDYAIALLEVIKDENIVLVKFSDENNDGLDEMLILDKDKKVKMVSYTGKAEISEYTGEIDESSFISKGKAVGYLEEKLIFGLKGSEEADVTESFLDANKLKMQNMIDYERNKAADGEMWVNSHIEKVYEIAEGVYYVKYTYAMRFGSVNLPSEELRSGDFTGGEYLQKYKNDLNEMYGYAIFGLNEEGENKYYLGQCSEEDTEYMEYEKLMELIK